MYTNAPGIKTLRKQEWEARQLAAKREAAARALREQEKAERKK